MGFIPQMAITALNILCLLEVTFLMVINMPLSAYRLPLVHTNNNFFIYEMRHMPHKREDVAESVMR